MKTEKRRRLEQAGWRVGSAADFLGMSEEEAAFVEMKVALAQNLRQRRVRQRLTQAQLAKRIHSSQSRVAKMEAADPSVSIDLLMQSLLAVGATRKQIASVIAPRLRKAA